MREMSIAEDRDWLLAEVERYRRESYARIAVKTRLQAERDGALATIAKVAAIVADPNAALVVGRIREVLEPTPKGKP